MVKLVKFERGKRCDLWHGDMEEIKKTLEDVISNINHEESVKSNDPLDPLLMHKKGQLQGMLRVCVHVGLNVEVDYGEE